MSILRLAVEAHLSKHRLLLRDLLNAAYFKRYGKPMPEEALEEDVEKWQVGINNIPYLYDFMLQTCEQ